MSVDEEALTNYLRTHGGCVDESDPDAIRDLAKHIRSAVDAARVKALREAADIPYSVSRGDIIGVMPTCGKRACGSQSGSGSEDLVVQAVANAFSEAIRRRVFDLEHPAAKAAR